MHLTAVPPSMRTSSEQESGTTPAPPVQLPGGPFLSRPTCSPHPTPPISRPPHNPHLHTTGPSSHARPRAPARAKPYAQTSYSPTSLQNTRDVAPYIIRPPSGLGAHALSWGRSLASFCGFAKRARASSNGGVFADSDTAAPAGAFAGAYVPDVMRILLPGFSPVGR